MILLPGEKMRLIKKSVVSAVLFTVMIAASMPVYAGQYFIKGRVIDGSTKKNVGFAIIVVQEAGIVINAAGGNYYADLPGPGKYTLKVQSDGLQTIVATVDVSAGVVRDFVLDPFKSKGEGVVIKGERVIQKVSRRTMKVEEIKEVPASFGDSVNALTSMPGVIRTSGSGFFGPLVIRGGDPIYNRYYIDGMPVDNPLHFGGIHSVIANDLMSEIDLYSSSFSAEYGGPLSAVISINTIDDVDDFGGWADVGIISAATLIKSPITVSVTDENGKPADENRGYIIASGRIGYLSLLIPLFYEFVVGEKLENVPEYWDYQFKVRYDFNSTHSLKLLCIGSKDYWRVLVEDKDIDVDEGDDPLATDLQLNYDQTFHNQGIYYTYNNQKIKNTLMVYSSWSLTHMYLNAGWSGLAADHWLKDYSIDCVPWILGGRDNFRWEWSKGLAELRGGLEATRYGFNAEGDSLRVTEAGYFDPTDPDAVEVVPFEEDFSNLVLGAYVEQRFTPGRLVVMPSFRSEWLRGTGYVTADPRGLLSYRFLTDTTLSIAGGHYSTFFQTNPEVFQGDPTYAAEGDTLEPEKAWHSTFGTEQVMGLFTGSIEVFYNYYYNLVQAYPHEEDGREVPAINSGKRKAWGCEFMIRKDSPEGDGFFGWGSYTFTTAKYKSGLPLDYDQNGDKWISSNYEQQHSLKIVAGYRAGSHSLSGRFQLYSSFPYTPIIGSYPPVSGRYEPIYDMDNVNSKHMPISHQLDLRYTHRTGYEWGHLSWYVEIINVYGQFNKDVYYDWKYNEPYSGTNPEMVENDSGINLIPNFGVEVKF